MRPKFQETKPINADLIWNVFIRSSFSAGEERAKSQESCHCVSLCLPTSPKPVSADQAVFPLMTGSEAPQDKMDAAIEDLQQSLSLLEKQFLQDKPFIVGNQISLADLAAIVEIMQVKVAKKKTTRGLRGTGNKFPDERKNEYSSENRRRQNENMHTQKKKQRCAC